MSDTLAETQELFSTHAPRCISCDAVRTGTYCAVCGQPEFKGRHSLGSLLLGGLGRIANLDAGLLYTARNLTIRPGEVVRDYLAGKTARYTHPIVYFLVAIAAFVLITRIFAPIGGAQSDRFIIFLIVPLVAAASRTFLRSAKFNYAEHLIVLLFLAAQVVLLLAVLAIGGIAMDQYAGTYAAGALTITLAYFAWAYSRVFHERAVFAAFAGVAALLAGSAVWAAALVLLLNTLRN